MLRRYIGETFEVDRCSKLAPVNVVCVIIGSVADRSLCIINIVA